MCKPKIRFRGCQGEWVRKKAKDIFITFDERKRPDLPVLAAFQDIRGMAVRSESGYDISHDRSNEITYKHVLPGQFVIHLRSFQGGFAHSSVEGITSPAYTVFGFKDADKHDDYYWKYIFMSKTFINRLKLITYGIRDGRSISFTDFADFEFVIPTLPEQRQIAAYFRSLDGMLSGCEARLSSLRRLKEGALQAFFPQQGETQPKIRFKGCQGEWERKCFDEIYQLVSDRKHNIPKSEYKDLGKYPIIDQGKQYIIGYTDMEQPLVPQEGYVVFGDHTREVKFVEVPFYTGADGTKVLKKKGEDDSWFLYYCCTSISIPNTGYNRHFKYLKEAAFYIPPTLNEQHLIAHFFRTLDRRIELERQRIEKLKQLKAACLEKMFV